MPQHILRELPSSPVPPSCCMALLHASRKPLWPPEWCPCPDKWASDKVDEVLQAGQRTDRQEPLSSPCSQNLFARNAPHPWLCSRALLFVFGRATAPLGSRQGACVVPGGRGERWIPCGPSCGSMALLAGIEEEQGKLEASKATVDDMFPEPNRRLVQRCAPAPHILSANTRHSTALPAL